MASFKAECGVIYELAYGWLVVGGQWITIMKSTARRYANEPTNVK